MTRILLVEDDASGAQAVCDILQDLPGRVVPVIAGTRDAAKALLEADFFDLMILDLTIPASDAAETPKPEYGFEVFGSAKECSPGMPIYILTGSSVEPFVTELLKNTHEVDIWGSGKIRTVSLLKKLKLDEFAKLLLPFVEGPHLLESVELERNGVTLSIPEERLLRAFAKRYQGARCAAWELKGGLSGARVLRVKVFNTTGGLVHHSVAKVGSIGDIQNEQQQYDRYIALLPPGVTPRKLTSLEYGAKATAAIFYGLAEGHDSSFFELAIHNATLCEGAIAATAAGLAPWRDAAHEIPSPVRRLRELVLREDDRIRVLAEHPIAWADEFEERSAQTKWGCIHGDFHGCNILLTKEGQPAVIDYGDIRQGPLSLDPITLELSIFFHPSSPFADSNWPDAATALLWGDTERYLEGCPCPDYVRSCRAWTTAIAAGQREIAAVAYCYLLRQLKFDNTNKQRALDLLEGAKRLWDTT